VNAPYTGIANRGVVKQSFGEPDFGKRFKYIDMQVYIKRRAGCKNKEQLPEKGI
jgi:hypothetical protein